jgi:hypothetical protein
MKTYSLLVALMICTTMRGASAGQGLTGTLIGTVKDSQGGVLQGARVRLNSPALIGGPSTLTTNAQGQLRFHALPPGAYVLEIEMTGFSTYREDGIIVGAGATIERTAVLKLAGLSESVAVEGAGSRIEARDPGFGTRFGLDDIQAIPTRRASMFDFIRAAPGVSATSPSSGTTTTISAFGSGTNENTFLIDGTNFTCPCNGVARAEPGVDFIHEVQVQAVGASVEFGSVQGAVINVVTRQGGERFLYDASYYAQSARMTSQPVRLSQGFGQPETGYGRGKYSDFTTNLGGPAIRDRLWFFGGYQYLRDYDSQPGTDPARPRTYEQNKLFAKLTWRLAPAWQLVQSVHDERWVNPEQPTLARPFAATLRAHASVPAVTFGHLTHTLSANTLWDVRVGRFVYTRADDPSTGDRTTAGHVDNGTGISSGAPQTFSSLTLIRTTAKATLSHYRPGGFGGDHQWKMGIQVERGEHRTPTIIPTGVRFVDINSAPSQSISSAPSNSGGVFITSSGFLSDALTLGSRLTINAGARFDHSRAISQDLHAVDLDGRETAQIVRGLGTLYTWNVWSPRVGVTAKLSNDGRMMLRASYGRFSQGVLTGELGIFHPGIAPITTSAYEQATGGYTRPVSVVDSRALQLDRNTHAPHTDEYSVGVDREVGRRVAVAIAYVRKNGANFIGWTDVAGRYVEDRQTVEGGRIVPLFRLDTAATPTSARRFLLTNQDAYSMTYDGVVMVVERRLSHGWQGYASYTLSRTSGLQPSSGAIAGAAHVSTVAPPPVPQGLTFGRDPNDLTNARGRLPNDRPHMVKGMGSINLLRTGVVLAANIGYFSGKPWAATTLISVPQNPQQQRVLVEARGARRLSSQMLLDMRLSRAIAFGGAKRVELLLDVLNVLNSTAEEGLISDNLSSVNFGKPSSFVDPRRAMVGVRMNLGR